MTLDGASHARMTRRDESASEATTAVMVRS